MAIVQQRRAPARRPLDIVAIALAPLGIVVIIGLRPGEKLHEELTNQGLSMRRTVHSRIVSAA